MDKKRALNESLVFLQPTAREVRNVESESLKEWLKV
jgi:hypothetical protein